MNEYMSPLSPREALEEIYRICDEDRNRGKRRTNIRSIWEIAYRGLESYEQNSSVDTSTIPLFVDKKDTSSRGFV